MTDGWDAGGWAGALQAQEEAWLETSPEQRLAWLEDAVAFVRAVAAASPPTGSRPAPTP